MKTIRAILIILTMVVFLPLAHAQLNKANKQFRLYRYAEAIPNYIKAAAKEKDPKLRAEAISRLADCYRFTDNKELAYEWYSKAVLLENAEPVNYLYYGQALQSKGDYMNAKTAFLKYSIMAPGDPRGSAYAASCDMPGRWDSIPPEFGIKNMSVLNSKWSDFGPAYYKDGLIFASDRRENFIETSTYAWTNNNYLDLYLSELQNPADPFGDANTVNPFSKSFNKPYHDGPATFSPDYSVVYLTRSYNDRTVKKDNIKNHLLKIFYAKTNGRSWSDEQPFFLNSEAYSVAHPSLSADGKTIYFSSDMPGGFGASDIWCCTRENDKWNAPVNLGKAVNTFGNEVFPFLRNDSTLFLASNGLPGYGGLDIFVAMKKNGMWQTPRNLYKPVNSSYDDFSFVLNPNDAQGFFSSNRPGGVGSDDIYAFKRLREIPVVKPFIAEKPEPFFISGYVKYKNSQVPAADATVYLLNTKTDIVKVLHTNSEGLYKTEADREGNYVAKVTRQNYISDCISFSTAADNKIALLNAPAELQLDKIEVNKVYELNNIYYDFDKWNIRSDAKPELDKLVQLMQENQISIELESHTDSRGSAQYNMGLSQKRAESVVSYIVQEGIASTRIKAVGYGESKLANQCADGVPCTQAEHQANRRTLFKIIKFNPVADNEIPEKNKFKEGDKIPVNSFDSDFFLNCLQDKLMTSPVSAPVKETPPAIAAKPQVKTPSPADHAKIPPPADKEKATQPASQAKKLSPGVIREWTAEKPAPDNITPKTNAITYRVQLYALSKFSPLNSAEFAKLKDVQYYVENGLYKYTAGIFNTAREAYVYREKVAGLGFGNAFLVAFKNGKRVDMPLEK